MRASKKFTGNLGRAGWLVGVLLLLGVCSGCAGKHTQKLDFNPQEPIRVAVLPFVQLDAAREMLEDDGTLLIDKVPLLSSAQADSPPKLMRKLVQSELRQSSLDIVSPALVDLELPHRGFGTADGKFDLKKIYSTPAATLCRYFLDCDAVLYGTVTRWERRYYGIQSINTVGLELKLVSARDGRVLYYAEVEDAEGRGLSKGPTGYTSVVLEPLKGLDSEIISGLASSVVSQAVKPLLVAKRPESLAQPPPALFAVSHDAKQGTVERPGPLVVLAFGSPGNSASFSMGTAVEEVPMAEISEGRYYGEYYPLPGERFRAQPVRVLLRDDVGRLTTLEVSKEPVTLP